MKFENRFLITKDRYMDWLRHPIKRGGRNIMLAAWIVLLLFTVSVAVYEFVYDEIMIGLYFGILAMLCLYMGFLRKIIISYRQFKIVSNMVGASQWERTITFTDIVTIAEGSSKTEYEYNRLTELVDYREYLALGIGSGRNMSYLRLAKDGFGQNSAQEFIEFIKQEHPNIRIRQA